MFRDRLVQEDSGGKCYCHEENGLNQQAAGGFSFQESVVRRIGFFLAFLIPSAEGWWVWWPLTSAEADKAGGISYCHRGLVILGGLC